MKRIAYNSFEIVAPFYGSEYQVGTLRPEVPSYYELAPFKVGWPAGIGCLLLPLSDAIVVLGIAYENSVLNFFKLLMVENWLRRVTSGPVSGWWW